MKTVLLFMLLQSVDTTELYPMESLCIMTQGIFSQELETVIREAVLGRGVKVYILVPPEFVQTPASFVPALSLLDGVYVRLIKHQEEFVIQDGARVFSLYNYEESTIYAYFLAQWEQGRIYRFLQSEILPILKRVEVVRLSKQ